MTKLNYYLHNFTPQFLCFTFHHICYELKGSVNIESEFPMLLMGGEL